MFDSRAGDVDYVSFAMGRYIENTGTTRVRFLEMLPSDHCADVSLSQWMGRTPPEVVREHLNLDRRTIAARDGREGIDVEGDRGRPRRCAGHGASVVASLARRQPPGAPVSSVFAHTFVAAQVVSVGAQPWKVLKRHGVFATTPHLAPADRPPL